MLKKIVILLVVCLLLTTFALAGARKGKPGYAVRDDNAMKEIVAIKQAMRGMERDIRALQNDQTRTFSPIEQGKIEGRLTWAENQINSLWKWVYGLLVLVILLAAVCVASMVSVASRKREKI